MTSYVKDSAGHCIFGSVVACGRTHDFRVVHKRTDRVQVSHLRRSSHVAPSAKGVKKPEPLV